jgi:hypothetical protein
VEHWLLLELEEGYRDARLRRHEVNLLLLGARNHEAH